MSIWTIIIALIVFGVIVIVHEMGHFFTAKFFGVTVHEFAVGMGPKIFSKTKNETDYSDSLLQRSRNAENGPGSSAQADRRDR